MRTTERTKLQPPNKPKHRSLAVLSRSKEVVPYFLQGDHDYIESMVEKKKIAELFEDDSVFAVGIGHISLRSYLDYEQERGEVLDTAVNRILWVFWALGQMADDSVTEKPDLRVENNVTSTPFGDMVGSLQRNVADVMVFLMTQMGRIVGINADGSYIFAPVQESDLLDLLDAQSLMEITENSTMPTFFEILALTGLHEPAATKVAETVAEDDEPKNSTSESKEGPSTRGSRPRGNSSARPSRAKPS